MTKPISSFDPDVVKSFSKATDQLKEQGVLTAKLALEQLSNALDAKQKRMVSQVLKLDPQDYGIGTPYIGLELVPADLVSVNNQQCRESGEGELKTLKNTYVPRHVHKAFLRMNGAFKAEYPKRALLIESGYRSPAYQVLVFLYWLTAAHKGDIAKTIRHASPPAYSQHCVASKTALDLKNIEGLPTNEDPEDFKNTIEYAWLRQHASAFNFYEPWPKNNKFGMRFEPWNWQYIADK